MKFKFIHSKKGYGKTKYILDEIKNSLDDKIIIFVPSHNTFMIENRLINYFGEEIFKRVEVMDFKKLTSRLLNKYKGIKEKRISDVGKNLLINYIIRNNRDKLKYFNSNNKLDFSDEILSTLIDFKNFNVKDEDIEKVLKDLNENTELYKKLVDFKEINFLYENYLKDKYLDPLDEMIIINSIIKNDKNMFLGYKFYIDGFEVITYYQYEFLKIILERGREVNLSLTLDKNNDNLIYSHMKEMKNKVLKILFDKNIYDIEEVYIEDTLKDCELKYLDNNYLNYKFKPYGNEPKNIFINKCLNNFYEVYEVCKEIRNLIITRGYRYKDIGILCRDIDSYENLIKVAFDEFNIPYFIDKKYDLKSNIFVIFLTSIFEIFNYNFSYSSLFKYIKSGLLNISYEDIFLIENFSLENGITGYKWKNDFNNNSKIKYSMKNISEDEEDILEKMNSIRKIIINPLVDLFNKVSKKNKVSFFINELYLFLKENLIIDKMKYLCEKFRSEGDLIYSNEILQTLNSIFEVFDEINNVFKDEEMSFIEFGEILIDSIKKIEISHVPMRLDEIIIGDVSRVSIGNYKALFIIGCVSSSFPKSYKKEDLLNDLDKKYLKDKGISISKTNKDKNLLERYFIYSVINIPKEFLYISYPISDLNGISLSPSIMISKIKSIFKNLNEITSSIVSKEFSLKDVTSKRNTLNSLMINLREDFHKNKTSKVSKDVYNFYKNEEEYKYSLEKFFLNLYLSNPCENLNNSLVEYLYNNSKFSVSSIETYSKCSFKYFLDYVIRVKRRKVYSFEPLDCGNFMHFLMENICKDISKNYDFKNTTREDIEKIIDNYFDENIFCEGNKNYILNSNNKFRAFGNKIKKIIYDSIFFTSSHLINSEFFHRFYEFEIGKGKSPIEIYLSENKKVNFYGKIDRIDICNFEGETFVNIIDYKSSVREIEYGKIYQSLNIQTISYMKYVLDFYRNISGVNAFPCGIFYFTLHSPNVKYKFNFDLENEIYKNHKYEGIFTNDINKLILIDKNLKNNSSNIIPIKLTKDGEFSKNISLDRVLSDEEFNLLLEFVHESIKNKLREIFNGYININPILSTCESKTCENCDYLGICKFSRNTNPFEILMTLNKQSFFELIKGDF